MQHLILFTDPLMLGPGLLAGIALLVVWSGDTGERHLPWWGASCLLLGLSIALLHYPTVDGASFTPALARSLDPAVQRLTSTGGLLASLGALCLYVGTRVRRGAPARRSLGEAGALLATTAAVQLAVGGSLYLRIALVDTLMGVAFLASAILLWPLGNAERLASALLVLRGVNGIVLTGLVAGYEMVERLRINQAIGFLVALLLICGSFLHATRSLRRLRDDAAALVEARTRELGTAGTELERAGTELDAFAWAAAHDLRAPLRTVNGFARMLEEDCETGLDAAGRARIEEICASATRLGARLDLVLQVARALRTPPARADVDLAQALRNAARDADLPVAAGAGAGRVRTDPDLLQLLLGLACGHAARTSEQPVAIGWEFGQEASREAGIARCTLRFSGCWKAPLTEGERAGCELEKELLGQIAARLGTRLAIERASGDSLRLALDLQAAA